MTTPPPDRASRHGEALDAILELAVLLTEDMNHDLERRGLTRSRTEVVWRVHHQGPMTQRALADALAVSARNVTGLVDALVETGFVRREDHPTDRRATLVTLTAKGKRAARDLEREHAVLADQLFAELPDEGFDGFRDGLGHVLAVLRRLVAAAR
jgi:DNA-binding MarR family transcriptional regulator